MVSGCWGGGGEPVAVQEASENARVLCSAPGTPEVQAALPQESRARGTPGDQPRPRPCVHEFGHTGEVTANTLSSSVPRAVFGLLPCTPRRRTVVIRRCAGRLPVRVTGLAPLCGMRVCVARARPPPRDRLLPRAFKRAASAGSGASWADLRPSAAGPAPRQMTLIRRPDGGAG